MPGDASLNALIRDVVLAGIKYRESNPIERDRNGDTKVFFLAGRCAW